MVATTQQIIGVWYDRYSSPDDNGWVVSDDQMNAKGEAETTMTVEMYDDYDSAREAAIDRGQRLDRPVIETDDDDGQECIYTPDDVTPIVG